MSEDQGSKEENTNKAKSNTPMAKLLSRVLVGWTPQDRGSLVQFQNLIIPKGLAYKLVGVRKTKVSGKPRGLLKKTRIEGHVDWKWMESGWIFHHFPGSAYRTMDAWNFNGNRAAILVSIRKEIATLLLNHARIRFYLKVDPLGEKWNRNRSR